MKNDLFRYSRNGGVQPSGIAIHVSVRIPGKRITNQRKFTTIHETTALVGIEPFDWKTKEGNILCMDFSVFSVKQAEAAKRRLERKSKKFSATIDDDQPGTLPAEFFE